MYQLTHCLHLYFYRIYRASESHFIAILSETTFGVVIKPNNVRLPLALIKFNSSRVQIFEYQDFKVGPNKK